MITTPGASLDPAERTQAQRTPAGPFSIPN